MSGNGKLRIATVVGARPQFIKAAAVSRQFRRLDEIEEILIHTGQHFDSNMSDVFFDEMDIPTPKYNLDIHNLSHGAMTGRMIESIEKVLICERPHGMLVYGDTNSTLAGAIAACKLNIPIAHVEAGLRSWNELMPEEHNRIITDRLSKYLFCPTKNATENLLTEGFGTMDKTVVQSGDVMYDAALYYSNKKSTVQKPESYEVEFLLFTLHRAENIYEKNNLLNIVEAINILQKKGLEIIWPIHPATRKQLVDSGVQVYAKMIDPVGYFEMLHLIKECKLVLTDSGGLQKEAFFFNKYCITLREETEWVELVQNGFNVLAGSNRDMIIESVRCYLNRQFPDKVDLYGNGNASSLITETLLKNL